jgi:hypothetical protein
LKLRLNVELIVLAILHLSAEIPPEDNALVTDYDEPPRHEARVLKFTSRDLTLSL